MTLKKILLISTLLLFMSSCGKTDQTTNIDGRWYTHEQVKQGKQVFKTHCATCHGIKAQGLVTDWRQPMADGSYPPPPLNGSAHAWHHPLSQLKRTIDQGGIPFGGKMPPFKDKLSEAEKESAIAYFQNFWSEKIYNAWIKRGGLR